ncbi:MAG: RNA polymerase sigma factor [Paracoccaceae bacterium]
MIPDLTNIWQQERPRVLATLIRLLGDFDLAEEALHDAFLAATERWPKEGIPGNPFGWLVSAGRFRAIDDLRRRKRFDAVQADLALASADVLAPDGDAKWKDDTLRLIFTCCHPALPPDAQVALTLRTICGLTTEEIARAFLVRTPTLAQRIVRAKARIREEGLRYEIPEPSELSARLEPVLRVIYLVFNEGYLAHSDPQILRADLSGEAIRLCRLLVGYIEDGEVMGLLGLMLCHEARRGARLHGGNLVPLETQDRSLWEHGLIAEGKDWIDRAFATRQIGPYALQGAIAAVHSLAATTGETDWAEIMGLYGVLLRVAPSPVVQLNRAIAVSMVHGPTAGLDLILPLLASGELADYHLAHLAEAEMLRQLDRPTEARDAYARAFGLCRLDPERRQIERRLMDLGGAT